MEVHHFKLDWHRYNIKQKIVGKATVTEEDFEEMSGVVTQKTHGDSLLTSGSIFCVFFLSLDVSSISGSDTETKDTSESNCSSQFNAMCLSSRLPKVYVTGDDNLLYSMYKCVVPNQKVIIIHRQTDRQIDRQTDRQTRQTDGWTNRQTEF